jgi:CBS domain-containing protein
MPLDQACWLALGSEGREEQTIATDQDNALILPEGGAARSLSDWLAFARAVNEDLAACGYPLCKGGIMASNPQWCLELPQWRERFSQWIGQGSPASLLNAAIFFDFRALAGKALLARQLRTEVQEQARHTPRFLKQMSDNALRNGPPSGLAGSALTAWLPGAEDQALDLKLHGTMPMVDAARLLALVHGVEATGTEARLRELAMRGLIDPKEKAAWVDAFEFFQTLRLRSQQDDGSDRPRNGFERPQAGSDRLAPNCLRMSDLSAIEQRALRESWRQMRRLQQRLALDFPG